MKAQTPNIAVVRSVWRRIKKAKIRDREPVRDVKSGGGGIAEIEHASDFKEPVTDANEL